MPNRKSNLYKWRIENRRFKKTESKIEGKESGESKIESNTAFANRPIPTPGVYTMGRKNRIIGELATANVSSRQQVIVNIQFPHS